MFTPTVASFSATADGYPIPALQWQSSSDGGASFADIPGATARTYTTPPTGAADDGKLFRLVATNASGQVVSPSAKLQIAAPVGQQGSDADKRTGRRLAVILVDFPDTPQDIKDLHFPSPAQWKEYLLGGRIAQYLDDVSYGQFRLSADVFGYFTHSQPGASGAGPLPIEQVMSIDSVAIPGFDAARYDLFAVVTVYDGPGWGAAGAQTLLVNGVAVQKPTLIVGAWIGHRDHDPANEFINALTLDRTKAYFIPTGTDQAISQNTTIPLSSFEGAFVHELGHGLGVSYHANSKTNGTAFDYEPETAGNNCLCFPVGFEAEGSLLDFDYGNVFDVMGDGTLGASMNMAIRDLFGWTDGTSRYTIKGYGSHTVTLQPVNRRAGFRTIEVRLPHRFSTVPGHKNRGYFLEVRSPVSAWDNMLAHEQLRENARGVMVLRVDGEATHLLDLSPSANITVNGRVWADLRDVTLKPGMTYANDEVRFSGVRANPDGSFSVKVDVLAP